MADVNPIQLQKYLKGVDYPASKEDRVRTARRHDADETVISTLERLCSAREALHGQPRSDGYAGCDLEG